MTHTLRSSVQALFALSVLSFFAGCASGPELEKYPRREIDRPYTVPEGVATWHIPTIFGVVKDANESVTLPPVPVPLIWETALSDDWNLLFYPLPLGVSHQFSNTESARTGFTLLNSFSYSSVSGFRLMPNLSFGYRLKTSAELAIDFTPSVTLDIPFESGEPFYWAAGINVGPLFQLSDTFALKPNTTLGLSRGWAFSRAGDLDKLEIEDTTEFSLSLGVSSVWSFARQWDLRPSYTFAGLASGTSLKAHLGVIEFVHFW